MEPTTFTTGALITMIILQIIQLGNSFFGNLKQSECCGNEIIMKDDKEKIIETNITEIHNHTHNHTYSSGSSEPEEQPEPEEEESSPYS